MQNTVGHVPSQYMAVAACRLLHLEGGSLGEVGVRSVVYFLRATIPNAQIIADQVKDLNRRASDLPTPAACLMYVATVMLRH
jgi:hypothetical protein